METIDHSGQISDVTSRDLAMDLGEGICTAAKLLEVDAGASFVAFLNAVAMAAGNAFKVRIPIFPSPLNLALALVVCHDDRNHNRLPQAISFFVQSLRDFQEQNPFTISDRGRKLVEEEIAKLEANHTRSASLGDTASSESSVAQIATLRRSLYPFVLIEDPGPGHLTRALRKSFDSALGVIYHNESLADLLDAVSSDSSSDLLLLRNGFWGWTYNAACFEAKPGQAVVQPAVPCFMMGSAGSLGRLFDTEEPRLFQLAGQTVLLGAGQSNFENAPTLATDSLGGLANAIRGILAARETRGGLVMETSLEAAKILVQFHHRQLDRSRSMPKGGKRFAENAVAVAAKLAGSSHLLSPDATQPIPAALMEKAVGTAERLAEDTASFADIVNRQHHETVISQFADKMFGFLIGMGKTKRWPLWYRFDLHPKDLMEPALDLLIRTGRARAYPDESIEAII
jgi:hypothetical protein